MDYASGRKRRKFVRVLAKLGLSSAKENSNYPGSILEEFMEVLETDLFMHTTDNFQMEGLEATLGKITYDPKNLKT